MREIQKAHVRMLGGHLTSQIRYYCTKDGLSIDAHSVVLRTRTSNALDFALLVQGLVPLLKAYECALQSGDERMRVDMAGAICQGISADPELFLKRVDLLNAYTMIEHVFVGGDRAGHMAYSPAGERHVRLLKEYGALIERLRNSLRDDCPRFRPVAGSCSPYGVICGLPSGLIEHMALKALERDAETRFCLEDVFQDSDSSGAKLAWVNGWRKLPHIDREVQRLYEYPQQFAEDIYNRIEHELSSGSAANRTGRLYVVAGEGSETASKAAAIPELAARYFVSSDKQPYDRPQLLRERQEGHFLVSYETSGGWVALKKDLLTEVVGTGGDARIAGLPREATQVLKLMCGGLVGEATGL
jgi:hypothetical protein